MDSKRARDPYYKYRAAVAYVAVKTLAGDETIGSALHVGDGIWVTAKHVVEGNTILDVGTTEYSIADYSGTLEAHDGVLDADVISAAAGAAEAGRGDPLRVQDRGPADRAGRGRRVARGTALTATSRHQRDP